MTTTRETLKALLDRGDLLPWLNGETEIFYDGMPASAPSFGQAAAHHYTFRPKPAPPAKVLRPWTWDELWEHRDCWFRDKDRHGHISRIQGFFDGNTNTAHIFGYYYEVESLCKGYEYLDADGEWRECGEWTEERPVME